MIDGIKKELCTGCFACQNVCPKDCLTMSYDEQGFRFPKVDYDVCIKCKKCVDVCPSLKGIDLSSNKNKPEFIAAWSLDEEIRINSTSGGIFSELAKVVLKDDGFVVGAIYNEKHLVEHIMIDDVKDLVRLRQSKYVQSDIQFTFREIKEKLKDDKVVTFCGAPCHVAGLKKYLNKDYDNLITIDYICRGTNSPKAYTKYIEMLENQHNSKISRVWFKNKTYGWNRFSTRIDFENGETYIKDRYNDIYMRGYIEENLYMRSCCFKCLYKGFPRVADLTLGDFWGIGAKNPELDENKGTSLIMINSQKGKNLYNKILDKVFSTKATLDDALPYNGAIVNSATKNPKSDSFLEMLDNETFDVCFKKHKSNRFIKRVKNKLKKIFFK